MAKIFFHGESFRLRVLHVILYDHHLPTGDRSLFAVGSGTVEGYKDAD